MPNKRLLLPLAVILSALPTALFAQTSPMPMQQLDYPVLLPGETATMNIQIPPDNGLHNGISYYLTAVELVEGERAEDVSDAGYRFSYVRCPPGFKAFHVGAGEWVYCSLQRSVPHSGGVMTVDVTNVGARSGETIFKGMLAKYGMGRGTWSYWRMYGVK